MKKHVLVLVALAALISSAQLMAQEPAQAPPAAPSSANGAAIQTPDVTQFLETLSCEQPEAPSDPAPEPSFMTGCSSNDDCPSGQLCCNLCGALPDDGGSCLFCVQPTRKGCPLVV
jgi:hypothetical protein